MKSSNKNIAIIIASFFLLGFTATPAVAGGYALTLGHHNGHSHGHYSYNYDHHYSYGHNYSYGNSYNYRQPNYYQSRSHNNYNNTSSYSKPCHQVSKTIVNDYGEYQRIGGTMCYDSYGQAYVVKGSRYLIR